MCAGIYIGAILHKEVFVNPPQLGPNLEKYACTLHSAMNIFLANIDLILIETSASTDPKGRHTVYKTRTARI
jgi:hypothetical protein